MLKIQNSKYFSPKQFFLPAEEKLFDFHSNKINLNNPGQSLTLSGVNSADLQAISLLDKIFANDFYYQSRRKKVILIDSNNSHFLDPLLAQTQRLSQTIKDSINDPIWDDLAKICLGCGICSYVCPLCYCTNLNDKIDLDNSQCSSSCSLCKGSRSRIWDSCLLDHFSQVAGKHNFRAKLRDRIYNWYQHKFVRFPKEYGQVGCTSCGRCIKYCPAKINYRKVLEEVLVKYS